MHLLCRMGFEQMLKIAVVLLLLVGCEMTDWGVGDGSCALSCPDVGQDAGIDGEVD